MSGIHKNRPPSQEERHEGDREVAYTDKGIDVRWGDFFFPQRTDLGMLGHCGNKVVMQQNEKGTNLYMKAKGGQPFTNFLI